MLASQLGYAWRVARRRRASCAVNAGGDDKLHTICELHGEALVRLGHFLLPGPVSAPGQALQVARPVVREATTLLASLARRSVVDVFLECSGDDGQAIIGGPSIVQPATEQLISEEQRNLNEPTAGEKEFVWNVEAPDFVPAMDPQLGQGGFTDPGGGTAQEDQQLNEKVITEEQQNQLEPTANAKDEVFVQPVAPQLGQGGFTDPGADTAQDNEQTSERVSMPASMACSSSCAGGFDDVVGDETVDQYSWEAIVHRRVRVAFQAFDTGGAGALVLDMACSAVTPKKVAPRRMPSRSLTLSQQMQMAARRRHAQALLRREHVFLRRRLEGSFGMGDDWDAEVDGVPTNGFFAVAVSSDSPRCVD